MKKARLAINGFGRIGRCVLRAVVESERQDLEVVAVNDLGPADFNAHLLRYDSVHGRFPHPVSVDGATGSMNVGLGPIRVTAERDPARLPWGEMEVDVVLECTGIFASHDKAATHLEAGARKVLISAPAEGVAKTIVFGVNHEILADGDRVVSNASCTTNCLAPVARVLHESVGIEHGHMTTIHAYTGDQPALDTLHKDPYRARAAAVSAIPTSTGAAKAVAKVLPELAGRLDGVAIRIPTPNVSAVDLTFVPSRKTTAEEINEAFRAAAEGPLRGIMAFDEAPKVSIDYNHDPHSASIAAPQTRMVGDRLARVFAWYDNEWGFSNRMCDTAAALARME